MSKQISFHPTTAEKSFTIVWTGGAKHRFTATGNPYTVDDDLAEFLLKTSGHVFVAGAVPPKKVLAPSKNKTKSAAKPNTGEGGSK